MKRMLRIGFFAFAALFVGGAALAQEPAKDAQGWQQVNGDMMQKGESIPAARLVGAAYGFIFAAVAVWVLSVARRARRLEDEVEALKKKIQARG
jgi:uncharacterized membrane protein